MTEPSMCRSCRAWIRWHKTVAGKNMPLDVEPHPEGNVFINDDGLAEVGKIGSRPQMFRSHFVTCPEARQWRKTT